MTKGRHHAGRVHHHAGRHHRIEPSKVAAVAVVTGTVLAATGALTGTALADPGGDVNWTAIGRCESGNNPAAADPSGQHLGMYQFTRSTWRANGGQGDPRNASPTEQTRVARNVKHTQGLGAWPVCGRHAWDGGSRAAIPAVHHPSEPRHAAPVPLVKHDPPTQPQVRPLADTTPQPATPPEGLLDAGWLDSGDVTHPQRTHTVQPDETLWGIAHAEHVADTGTTPGWRTLADTNHLDSPDIIQPGQVLELPT